MPQKQAIEKAAALVEAHAYIRRFAGQSVVVKVGGSIMDQPSTLQNLLRDVCFMSAVGMRPIIVHGGGKAISKAMSEAGLDAQFVQGHRYTDERTLAIAEHVLINQISAEIIAEIQAMDQKPIGLNSLSSCVVFGQRLFLQAQEGRKVDIGMVGEVATVNAPLINALLEADYLPVIAPIARDRAGGKLNINADSVAGHVAAAINAEKLVLVSDTHGIRRSEDSGDLATHLTRAEIKALIDADVIGSGMLPKVEAAFTALEGGVKKVHIVDGGIPHALLLEIYTDTGVGTEIVT